MGSSGFRLFAVCVVAVLLAIAWLFVSSETSPVGEDPSSAAHGSSTERPAETPHSTSTGLRRTVDDVAIKNYGEVIHRGSVDLSATIDRIRAGIKHPHRNDGSVFGNRERLLPRRERGYYREYVHPTAGISGAGPQRIVVGADGDWWYTADHYASFVSLGQEAR